MKPVLEIEVRPRNGEPLYSVTVVDVDHPVNFHSYDCLFFEEGRNLDELKERALTFIEKLKINS